MDHRTYVLKHTKELDEVLRIMHGTPNHNNKEDPLDELFFILLSRRTRNRGYEKVYEKLKSEYPSWTKLAKAPEKKIYAIVKKAGLGKKRATEIKYNLKKIHDKFGAYSLKRLRKWNDNRTLEFLTSLKGIGPKSAYCIMMYSLKRKVFPADTHVIRICKRLGIINKKFNHKASQKELADIFPERIRYSLHVNMVSHGRSICRSINPKCSSCLIKGFCYSIRTGQKRNAKKPGILDIFAGAGGMSLGFEKSGFDLVAAIELNEHACTTLLHNRPDLPAKCVINQMVQNVEPETFKDKCIQVIVAGPPCQEFSKVRKNGFGEFGRKELYKEVLRFVAVIKPMFVVIENVPGMDSDANKKYVDRVEHGLMKHGYLVRMERVQANRYGIPQNRLRIFFIARRILDGALEEAEDSLDRIWDRIKKAEVEKPVTFKQGISGLPRLPPGSGVDVARDTVQGRRSNYVSAVGGNGGLIYNHTSRKHNPRDLEAYQILEEGENARDLYGKRPDLMPYSLDNFPTKFYKIKSKAPAPTIVAHLKKDANSFINPFDNRGISPREAARLQAFPDWYRFFGSFGLQFEQIGNAVPPMLAEIVGTSIRAEMYSVKNRPS